MKQFRRRRGIDFTDNGASASRKTPARFTFLILAVSFLGLSASSGHAQRGRRGGGRFSGYRTTTAPPPKREIFPGNTFTFCRIQYRSVTSEALGHGWNTDYPDADINFSIRLAELTTIKINHDDAFKDYDNPGGIVHSLIRLTDDALFEYPIIYMVDVGVVGFNRQEAERLGSYLRKGGFLHVDDFWGDPAWRKWVVEIGKALPPDEYPIVDIPLDHPIFNIVFQLDGVPQVPSIQYWRQSGGKTAESVHIGDTLTPHGRGIFDEDGRLMVFMTHNTDIADGWENYGKDPDFSALFSEPKAVPLGINIVAYALTSGQTPALSEEPPPSR